MTPLASSLSSSSRPKISWSFASPSSSSPGSRAFKLGPLLACAVVTHPDEVDYPLDAGLSASQALLPESRLIDLLVAELAPREGRIVWRVGLQVSRGAHPFPEPVTALRPDCRGDCLGIELGVEQVLQMVQVVAPEVPVAKKVLRHRR